MQPGCLGSRIQRCQAGLGCHAPKTRQSSSTLWGRRGSRRGAGALLGTQWLHPLLGCCGGSTSSPSPSGLPLSLLQCTAGSPILPQAALETSPKMCYNSFCLTFFPPTYRLGKQQQVILGGYWTWDPQSPMEDFAFQLRRCVSVHRGCPWQNTPCLHGEHS